MKVRFCSSYQLETTTEGIVLLVHLPSGRKHAPQEFIVCFGEVAPAAFHVRQFADQKTLTPEEQGLVQRFIRQWVTNLTFKP